VEDQPHKPFAYLSATSSGAPSLGTLGARRVVTTDLEVPIGPLALGQVPFDPDTSVRATPLAMGMGDPDGGSLTPSCRLSNRELTRLLKSANHGRATMLSPEAMTSFPFRVVTYDDEWMERWLTLSGPGWEQLLPQPPTPLIAENPITIEIPVSVAPEVSSRYDTSWEDPPPPSPPPLARQVAIRPHSGRTRFQQSRSLNASQGLLPDYSPRERSSGWSRKRRG
jgi:hypothetical protein